MKNLILICCVLAATNCFAQKDTTGLNMPFNDGALIYQGVVPTPGISKNDLYKNSKQWFVDIFKNSKYVIQSEDKEDGKIVGKGVIYAYKKELVGASRFDNTISILVECKDDRYRYKIYDMSISSEETGMFSPVHLVDCIFGTSTGGWRKKFSKKASREILLSIDFETKLLISSLKKSMSAKPDDF